MDASLDINLDTQMTCEHCKFHDNLKSLCRRRAPTQMLEEDENPPLPYCGWPTVCFDDWCGELEVTEEVRMAILKLEQ